MADARRHEHRTPAPQPAFRCTMRILLEAAHPAHVHFLTPIGHELIARGHETVLAIRPKDVTRELAERSGLRTIEPHFLPSRGRNRSLSVFSQAGELLRRILWLRSQIRRFAFDLVVTRNPSGVIAARLACVPSIFDTDDGRAAGIHFRLARPFATIITTPELFPDELGDRQRRYRDCVAGPSRAASFRCVRSLRATVGFRQSRLGAGPSRLIPRWQVNFRGRL